MIFAGNQKSDISSPLLGMALCVINVFYLGSILVFSMINCNTDNRQKKYEAKRIKKTVSFNAERDKELLDFVNSVNFSNWVKEQIKKVQH